MERNYYKLTINNELILQFIEKNYLKNRTIASDEISGILNDVQKYVGAPLKTHEFATGSEYCTWVTPPSWNVKEAWLKSSSGQVIASYNEHPLFVCPYSISVDQKFTKEDLEKKVYLKTELPDAFFYNRRLGMDYRLRLKDFMISLPLSRFNALRDDETYHLKIDVQTNNNPMLVGEINSSKNPVAKTVYLVADFCHPGQVNDSFSGLVLFMEAMKILSSKITKYNYRLLVLPETIGSIAYIDRFQHDVKNNSVGMIFSEMIAWGEKWYVKSTRTGSSYFDSINKNLALTYPEFTISGFNSIYGNDELIFDSVGVGVPSISLQKYPFKEYHSSEDSPEKINFNDIQNAYSYLNDFIFILENNAVYKQTHIMPFWMTRYDLYSDPYINIETFRFKFKVIYELIDGNRTALEIANDLKVPFSQINSLMQQLMQHNLVSIVSDLVER